MSAELAAIERRLDTTTALLSSKLELVLRRLDEIVSTGKRGLTQVEYAKLVGVTPRTVSRWVAEKRLRLVRGKVPYAEAAKHLS